MYCIFLLYASIVYIYAVFAHRSTSRQGKTCIHVYIQYSYTIHMHTIYIHIYIQYAYTTYNLHTHIHTIYIHIYIQYTHTLHTIYIHIHTIYIHIYIKYTYTYTYTYNTHTQEYEQARGKYIITRELMESMQKHAVVLHPLPRVDEVSLLFLLCME